MNFLTHTTSFVCSKIRLIALSLCECKSVFCSVIRHVYVRKIYSSIPKKLKFDWSIQVTCKWKAIVNQICLSKQFSFEHIHWYESWQILLLLSFLISGQVVYFDEADYCTNLSHYLQLLAKVLQNIGLKNFAQFAGKYRCRRLF